MRRQSRIRSVPQIRIDVLPLITEAAKAECIDKR